MVKLMVCEAEPARIVCPDRVGRLRHVHCWRTRQHTINKFNPNGDRWINRPCLNISACNRWIQIGYRHASNKCQVLGIVVEDSDLFVNVKLIVCEAEPPVLFAQIVYIVSVMLTVGVPKSRLLQTLGLRE